MGVPLLLAGDWQVYVDAVSKIYLVQFTKPEPSCHLQTSFDTSSVKIHSEPGDADPNSLVHNIIPAMNLTGDSSDF